MNDWCSVYAESAFSQVSTVSDIYQTAVCVAKLKDVTDTRIFQTMDDSGRIDILWLEPDTTYYYYTLISSLVYSTGSVYQYSSFHTPKTISLSNTGNIIASWTTLYLSGSTSTGITYDSGWTQK